MGSRGGAGSCQKGWPHGGSLPRDSSGDGGVASAGSGDPSCGCMGSSRQHGRVGEAALLRRDWHGWMWDAVSYATGLTCTRMRVSGTRILGV